MTAETWLTILLFPILGILAWIYRSLIEDDYEPFVLNLTLFAGVGVIVIFVENSLTGQDTSLDLAIALLASLIVMFAQIFVYRKQINMTRSYLREVLEESIIDEGNHRVLENWTFIGLEIMRVDFYPEFYKNLFSLATGEDQGPRYERKERFLGLLPSSEFEKSNLTPQSFEVPPDKRSRLWRLYFIVFFISWVIYLYAAIFPNML